MIYIPTIAKRKMNNLRKKLENDIIVWNNQFPLDYWWRNKYNIPFGSKAHREMSFIDMYRDWLEEKMIKEQIEKEKHNNADYNVAGEPVNQDEIDDAFENLDPSKY